MSQPPRELRALLEVRAARSPDAVGYSVIEDDRTTTDLRWRALHEDALAAAGRLRDAGLRPRDRMLVVLDHRPDLIRLLWAGILAGAPTACFHYLTRRTQVTAYTDQIVALARRASLEMVVTFGWFAETLRPALESSGTRVVALEDLNAASPGAPVDPAGPSSGGHDETLLFLSGGTTGRSKIVPLGDAAVLAQLAMTERLDMREDQTHAHWVPLSHDMGLTFGFLVPAYTGARCTLVSSLSWARAPGRFMRLLADQRAVLTAMPNFGLDHTARHVRDADVAQLDLSALRRLVCASEPVRERSIARFASRFAAAGLRPDALVVAYGMAEATCGLTTTLPGPVRIDRVQRGSLEAGRHALPSDDPETATAIVSCGVPLTGVELRITDHDGRPHADRVVGEIEARSPALMPGYLAGDHIDRSAFTADGWYRTGDLGYMAEGELFVCGRRSDFIICAGRNVYPQEVEELIESVPGIRPRGAVAFGVDHPRQATEGVVVVAEIERGSEAELSRIDAAIRASVEAATGVVLLDLRLVGERGWILRGASGKVARLANRAKYLEAFGAAVDPPSDPV